MHSSRRHVYDVLSEDERMIFGLVSVHPKTGGFDPTLKIKYDVIL